MKSKPSTPMIDTGRAIETVQDSVMQSRFPFNFESIYDRISRHFLLGKFGIISVYNSNRGSVALKLIHL
jgi:hypothetical protein